jgi:hypothetical protein
MPEPALACVHRRAGRGFQAPHPALRPKGARLTGRSPALRGLDRSRAGQIARSRFGRGLDPRVLRIGGRAGGHPTRPPGVGAAASTCLAAADPASRNPPRLHYSSGNSVRYSSSLNPPAAAWASSHRQRASCSSREPGANRCATSPSPCGSGYPAVEPGADDGTRPGWPASARCLPGQPRTPVTRTRPATPGSARR